MVVGIGVLEQSIVVLRTVLVKQILVLGVLVMILVEIPRREAEAIHAFIYNFLQVSF